MSEKVKAKGTAREVWNGTARHTAGGLTKSQLMKNKHGKIVSKKKHAAGKRLVKLGILKPYTKSNHP